MPIVRVVLLAVLAILPGSIAWAAMRASLGESFAAIIADSLGAGDLIDLYAGFVAAAVIVFLVEPRRGVSLAVAATLPFLGNLVLLAWLAGRGLGLLARDTKV